MTHQKRINAIMDQVRAYYRHEITDRQMYDEINRLTFEGLLEAMDMKLPERPTGWYAEEEARYQEKRQKDGGPVFMGD